jgi:uncharacterized protein (DUF1684 family)
MSDLSEFRASKDVFFRDHPRSPLTAEQRSTFERLDYFAEDDMFVVRAALEIDGIDRDEPITMQTTDGGQQIYRRAGTVGFEVDGQRARVTLFSSPDMHELFLPFRDHTSGSESYGAGRYLEVEPPGPDGRVVVDFNHAYNPYCAYNPDWACPIPPGENWLGVPIRAGEKTFSGAFEPGHGVE